MTADQAYLPNRVDAMRRGPIKISLFCAYGLALRNVAALMIRYRTKLELFGRSANVVVYAVTIPGSALLAISAARQVGLARGQMLVRLVVGTIRALLVDGMVTAWTPGIYGPDASATLPWGCLVVSSGWR